MEFSAIVSASERKSTYDVRISGHMYLDVPRRRRDAMFIGDGEWDEVFAYVVDESFGGFDWYRCASRCCACISWGGRWPY